MVSQFYDCNHTNIVHAIVFYMDVYISVFVMGSICFVVCIDFNVDLFCFVKFGIHFQCVSYGACVCVVATINIIM
jgi:hypothetical protein